MKAEELLASLSPENLRKARRLRDKMESDDWGWEIDALYRYFHDSFKMFNLAGATECYLRCLLALVGREDPEKPPLAGVRKLDLHPKFIRTIEDALVRTPPRISFTAGAMKHEECATSPRPHTPPGSRRTPASGRPGKSWPGRWPSGGSRSPYTSTRRSSSTSGGWTSSGGGTRGRWPPW